jgi:hypothetical protein
MWCRNSSGCWFKGCVLSSLNGAGWHPCQISASFLKLCWDGSRIVNVFGREPAVAGSGEELFRADFDYADLRRAHAIVDGSRQINIVMINRVSFSLMHISTFLISSVSELYIGELG